MTFHVLVGFVLPWLVGVFFIKKASKTMLLVFAVTAFLALLFNDIGAYAKWWEMTPHEMESITTIPYSLGVYPIILTLMYRYVLPRIHPVWFVLLTALVLTLFESALVLSRRIEYHDGWNVGWTYVSYVLSVSIVFIYARLLLKAFGIPKSEVSSK
ncbi:CBO0543 family protein [Cohnella thailandensis]|uniref:Uncharacterized protein n=1 Tax=Cohnella thailandensis TaxID=557557 RepID=A0A841SZZ7_9BACL|nr:CBO0543 family protein [Cohnella thailandensis]MBB6635835.1 hypothetical protein [Cohnella thailandensis]MBP1976213.1 hypothetical protein [Cohnella thailandensis]